MYALKLIDIEKKMFLLNKKIKILYNNKFITFR